MSPGEKQQKPIASHFAHSSLEDTLSAIPHVTSYGQVFTVQQTSSVSSSMLYMYIFFLGTDTLKQKKIKLSGNHHIHVYSPGRFIAYSPTGMVVVCGLWLYIDMGNITTLMQV